MNLLSLTLKADQSDFLLPVEPVGNSARLPDGALMCAAAPWLGHNVLLCLAQISPTGKWSRNTSNEAQLVSRFREASQGVQLLQWLVERWTMGKWLKCLLSSFDSSCQQTFVFEFNKKWNLFGFGQNIFSCQTTPWPATGLRLFSARLHVMKLRLICPPARGSSSLRVSVLAAAGSCVSAAAQTVFTPARVGF